MPVDRAYRAQLVVFFSSVTVKPVLSSGSKIDKKKVLKTGGSFLEHSAILLTCTKRLSVLKPFKDFFVE